MVAHGLKVAHNFVHPQYLSTNQGEFWVFMATSCLCDGRGECFQRRSVAKQRLAAAPRGARELLRGWLRQAGAAFRRKRLAVGKRDAEMRVEIISMGYLKTIVSTDYRL